MVDAPAASVVTIPVAGSIVATAKLLLLHVPPAVASISMVLAPAHTEVTPVIAAGSRFTVTAIAAAHPAAVVYTIVVVSADTPATMPEARPTLATPVLTLLHDPPVRELCNGVVLLTQTDAVPVIAGGV